MAGLYQSWHLVLPRRVAAQLRRGYDQITRQRQHRLAVHVDHENRFILHVGYGQGGLDSLLILLFQT